jgi:hypothetical protein
MSKSAVFLSHTTEDKKWVRDFAEALSEHGIPVWLADRDLAPGQSWREAIEKALRESESIISVIDTAPDQEWSWVLYEIGLAMGMKKPILLILPPDAALDHLPKHLRERAVLRKSNPEEVARKVAKLRAEARA